MYRTFGAFYEYVSDDVNIYLVSEWVEQLSLIAQQAHPCEQEDELFCTFPQVALSGQPIHFFPLFLDLYIYKPARMIIAATITMTMILAKLSPILSPRDYLLFIFCLHTACALLQPYC